MKKTLKWLKDFYILGEKADIHSQAGALAFSTSLALIPFLAISVAILKYLGIFETLLIDLLPEILSILAVNQETEVTKEIIAITSNIKPEALGLFGFISLFFTSTFLVNGIEISVQKVWDLSLSKQIGKRLIIYWLIIILAPITLTILWGLIQSGYIPIVSFFPNALLIWLGVSIICSLVIKWVPNTFIHWRAAIISGLAIGIATSLGQNIYEWLTTNIFILNRLYGSMASIPIFLLWLLVVWHIFLYGCVLCLILNDKNKQKTI